MALVRKEKLDSGHDHAGMTSLFKKEKTGTTASKKKVAKEEVQSTE
ncbi:hypothetical protein ASZ90_008298 [hydrocarbon metagenome]|uniref:Uncharacterized protein n=1 Tax=hydrocarbon metagenome TaxID=938273 RepID=A0A0W8FM44_9ZZZZ